MRSEEKNSRRDFIKKSAASAAAFIIVPRHVLGGRGYIPPSDKVNIGIVGAGGQSMYSIGELLKLEDVQLTSIADPSNHWTNDILYSFDTGRGPTKKFIEANYSRKAPNYKMSEYEDFRVMLEKERSLDAIVCATPDNTHAYVSIFAMRKGKHVYCEKPLTHNIWEARKVREVARETGLATQMGNQGTSQDNLRLTVEYLRAGAIGTVREAHSWVSATRWLPALNGFPRESTPIPDGFNWDLWLGPTSWHPYNKVYTPVKWRDFWAFGCGALGDFGCHDMNSATWAFDLHIPESVEVLPAGKGNSDIAPYGEIGYYKFAANGEQPPIKLTWYSGGLHPDLPELLPRDLILSNRGAMFVGDKGIILNNGGISSAPQIFPDSLKESFAPPAQSIPRSRGHHREWIDAIKGGPAAFSNFEYGARLTEIVLLGVLSLRLGGKKIYWDAANMKAVGLPEADSIIREPVREGWEMA
ncbi:MAG: Gfo/Idh/MocA family oxidoreductase [Bacteroidales bacterium]|nr:Gfo/Idh/MocA family oxidoreductase [Bacteroidales bacterium]